MHCTAGASISSESSTATCISIFLEESGWYSRSNWLQKSDFLIHCQGSVSCGVPTRREPVFQQSTLAVAPCLCVSHKGEAIASLEPVHLGVSCVWRAIWSAFSMACSARIGFGLHGVPLEEGLVGRANITSQLLIRAIWFSNFSTGW